MLDAMEKFTAFSTGIPVSLVHSFHPSPSHSLQLAAEQLGAKIMETRRTVLGPNHPDTLTSMANLASTYMNQGRWKEAEELQVKVMGTVR